MDNLDDCLADCRRDDPRYLEFLEHIRREYDISKDERIKALDPNSPSYTTAVEILREHPDLTPEELREMADLHGFTIDLV